MARTKKNRSLVIDNAETRAAALAAIEPPLNLGEALPLTGYQERIAAVREKLARYNQLLAEAEEARVVFLSLEKQLALHSTRMLAAVGATYGKDSTTYAAAGGTPLQLRKRPVRKAASGGEKLPNAA